MGIWETTIFRRIECIASSPSDALLAVDERLRRMRAGGWVFPPDAAIDLRTSGFGWAARVVVPDMDRKKGFELRRRVDRPRRMHSTTRLREVAEIATDLADGALKSG